MRKFYRTIIMVEVLSEDEPIKEDVSLGDIQYEITEGHHSGVIKSFKSTLLSGRQAVKALLAQGSDPGFFSLNLDGSQTED